MSKQNQKVSRRRFFRQTIGGGVAASLATVIPTEAAGIPAKDSSRSEAILVRVGDGAGPAPFGAPAETAVPFPKGQVTHAGDWVVFSPKDDPMITQARPSSRWDDGSVRWLSVVFEAAAGPGNYELRNGDAPASSDLIRSTDDELVLATDLISLKIPRKGGRWLEAIEARDDAKTFQSVLKGTRVADLVLTRHDGKVFRASRDGESRRVVIEERGPMRASVRLEGKCRAEDSEPLFDYIVRLTVYRARPEVHLSVTWLNASANLSEQIRDIRIEFPFEFGPARLVFGCETGVYDGPYLEDWPVYILQEDHDQYWARTLNPDGRVQNLSSGGCNGEHAPGWLYIQNDKPLPRCLGSEFLAGISQ